MRTRQIRIQMLATAVWTLCASTFAIIVDVSRALAAEVSVQEAYADLPAGRIFYRDSGGKGQAVVFLHAGSGNSAIFEKQVEPIVKAGFRFITFDRAGVAKSTRAEAGAATPASSVPEIEQLMDYLKIDRFHIVGAAAGGGIGLQYTLQRPARVLSVTVSNSLGNVQDAAYSEIGTRLRPPAFNLLPPEMRELGPSYRAVNPEGVARWLSLNGEAVTPGAPPPGGRLGGGPGVTGGPGGPLGGGVTFAALEKLKVPTLLLTGDADLYTPPSVLRMFKERMKQAEMYIIPESAHAAHWENPDEFNRRVIAFLRKHRRG
jgi:pimeloyl-ACP methyl ester carboxylesterase